VFRKPNQSKSPVAWVRCSDHRSWFAIFDLWVNRLACCFLFEDCSGSFERFWWFSCEGSPAKLLLNCTNWCVWLQ